MSRAGLAAAVVGVAVIAGIVYFASRASSGGATRGSATPLANTAETTGAPVARAKVRGPSPGLRLRADAGEGAGELSDAAPGAAAFRRYTDDYVDAQPAVAKEHMAREQLTMDETRELTYFAVLAMESQDWARVEGLTGKALSSDQRREVWESMMARSQEMRRHMGEQIASGADEGSRWETIGRVESGYLSDYYRITGMTPALLDQLLLASVREQRVGETLASVSPEANEGPPPGTGGQRGVFVRRDPLHPERPPVPVDHPPPP